MKKTIQSGDYHIKIVDGYLIFEGEGDSVIFPDDNENMVISSGSGSSDVILTAASATEGDVLVRSDSGEFARLSTDLLTVEQTFSFPDESGTLALTSPYAFKPTDTARSNTDTLADDPDLAGIELLPDTFYIIEGYLDIESVSVIPDIQWVFSETTVSQNGNYIYSIIDGAGTSTSDRVLFTDTVVGDIAASTPTGVNIKGFLYTNSTTGPTVSFQWAQSTSDSDATVLGQGSWIRFIRV